MSPFEQLPPHDLEAEEGVIASAMVSPEHVALMATIVQPSAFFREKNGWIWGAILDLHHRGEGVNQVTVAHRLATLDRLEECGGQTYLSDVIRSLKAAEGAQWYAELVAKTKRLRDAISAASEVSRLAYESDDPDAIYAKAQELFGRLGAQRARKLSWTAHESMVGTEDEPGVVERINARLETPEYTQGYKFDWPDLEELTDGLVPTRLLVVMGDTSAGKSYLLHYIAWRLAKLGTSVWMLSTEMSHEEITMRHVEMECGFTLRQFDDEHRPTTGQKQRILAAEDAVDRLPITIFDTGRVQLRIVEAEVRRQVDAGAAQVVMIDHLQHMRVDGMQGAMQMEEVVGGAKAMAMMNRVPVIAVSHVNRDAAKNGIDIHSGKWGSAIEQDANQMLIVEAVDRLDGRWEPMTERAADEHRAKGWLPVRIKLGKVRDGARGYAIAAHSWNVGGRFIAMSDVLL